MKLQITLEKAIKKINLRLERLVSNVFENPISSKEIKQLRDTLKSIDVLLTTAESLTEGDAANEIFELNDNWKYIYFRDDLNKHSVLYSDLDLNERKLFKAIIINHQLGNNPNFYSIMLVVRKIVISGEINLPKVGPLIAKSLPTLITKLQKFCNLELELRKNRT
jgi:hypothetical protein